MKTNLRLLLLVLASASASQSHAASVFFSQAVDSAGTLVPGGMSGTSTLPIYAPIRETAGSQILGYAEVTLGTSNAQNLTFPRTDGTDTYIYQQVNGGVNSFAELNFRFVAANGVGNPVSSMTIGVSELYIRVDGRGATTGGGFLTADETNTVTLSSAQTVTWEVAHDLGIVTDSINGGILDYSATGTLNNPAEFIQWRAFDPEGDNSITGFTWRLDNNGGSNNATHLQLDLAPIPEPATALLGALGLLGLMRRRRI